MPFIAVKGRQSSVFKGLSAGEAKKRAGLAFGRGSGPDARRVGGTKGGRGPLVFSERQGDLTREFYFSQDNAIVRLANPNSSLTVKVAADYDKKQSALGSVDICGAATD